MTKKEGGESPGPSRRDPRVYGPPQKDITIKGVYLTGNEPDEKGSSTQVEATIPTEREKQQQAQ